MFDKKGENNVITRRDFIVCSAASAGAVGATVCLSEFSGCSKVTEVGETSHVDTDAYIIEDWAVVVIDLDKVAEIGVVGGSVKIVDARLYDSLIIARVGDEEYVVASIRCTHCGSELEYHHDKGHHDKGRFICCRTGSICSGAGSSAFDLEGNRVDGPADRPIRIYRADLEGSRLKVDIKE